jgi:hypothetical protein
MKGIQNKVIISQKVYIIHIYGLRHYKGKLSTFFSINVNAGSLGGTTNIQTILYLVPRCVKRVWCYRSHSVPYAGFQVLTVVDLNLVDNIFHVTTQETSSEVRSDDLGSQAIGPPLPIYLPTISLTS